MWISPAYAQAAGGGDAGLVSLLPLVLIFVVFYFLLIRPQQKKMKAHKAMIEAVRRGDRVVTGGGLIGTVTKVLSETELQVEVADGVRVRVVRGTLQDVLSKPEPADKAKSAEKADNGGAKAANDSGAAAQKPKSGLAALTSMLGGWQKSGK
jgi:preprotein translocase subunit YajC